VHLNVTIHAKLNKKEAKAIDFKIINEFKVTACAGDTTQQPQLAGALRVKSYPLTLHRVVVVPVGTSNPGFTPQQLQATLNTIYDLSSKFKPK
jgi:hypothetical protein